MKCVACGEEGAVRPNAAEMYADVQPGDDRIQTVPLCVDRKACRGRQWAFEESEVVGACIHGNPIHYKFPCALCEASR